MGSGAPVPLAAYGGWVPRVVLGAPAPGGLLLPPAQPTAAWLYAPRAVVGRDGGVWVADTGNHRVVRFDASGVRVGSWGARGSAPGELFEPMGLAVDASGDVVVCYSGNGRVQVFRPDGTLRVSFAVPGWRREVFSEPHVAVDSVGLIWVTVPLAGEIRAYSPEGELRQTVSGASLVPPVRIPIGIAFDHARSQLVVTDIEDRLVRFPWPRLAGNGPVSGSRGPHDLS